MIAKDLINYMIPPLKPDDPIDKAFKWMDELRINELPVVDNGKFMGIISEKSIMDHEEGIHLVQDVNLQGIDNIITEDHHYYEVLKLAYREGLKLVAVLDTENMYAGVVSVEDVVEAFAQTSSIKSAGAIILLHMRHNDYSLSEISRLVESNNAKILSSYITADIEDPEYIILTLKINLEDPDRVLATLERFGYKVQSKHVDKSGNNADQERYDILMKYLQI